MYELWVDPNSTDYRIFSSDDDKTKAMCWEAGWNPAPYTRDRIRRQFATVQSAFGKLIEMRTNDVEYAEKDIAEQVARVIKLKEWLASVEDK
jgi:hypothetical protein